MREGAILRGRFSALTRTGPLFARSEGRLFYQTANERLEVRSEVRYVEVAEDRCHRGSRAKRDGTRAAGAYWASPTKMKLPQ